MSASLVSRASGVPPTAAETSADNLYKTLQNIVHVLDSNNSGTIYLDEFRPAYFTLNPLATEADVRRVFDEIDSNNSGCISIVELGMHYGFKFNARGLVHDVDATGLTDEQIISLLMLNSIASDHFRASRPSPEMREATRINVLAELAKQKKSGIVPEVIRHRQSFLPEVVELDSLREGKRRARQASISFLDACTLGDGKAIAQALEAGVNVQVSDDRGEGALHNWARATTGDADSARTAAELLKAGIDIDYQDHHGKTAAHFAAEYGHSKMLAWLYAKGANMHLTTVDGWTVLHEAVFKGDKASIDMLLHMVGGPDINARDASARTALHIAAYRCDEEVLLALINNGADPSINDKSSLFPEDLARRAHRSGSVNMLKGLSVRRASAEPNT